MANQEPLDILKQGVGEWNQWKQEHFFEMRPPAGPQLSSFSLVVCGDKRAASRTAKGATEHGSKPNG